MMRDCVFMVFILTRTWKNIQTETTCRELVSSGICAVWIPALAHSGSASGSISQSVTFEQVFPKENERLFIFLLSDKRDNKWAVFRLQFSSRNVVEFLSQVRIRTLFLTCKINTKNTAQMYKFCKPIKNCKSLLLAIIRVRSLIKHLQRIATLDS